MKTAVGVFAAHERAEQAVESLLAQHVPEERIIYLTRSESDARQIGKRLSHSAGLLEGAAGRPAGAAGLTPVAVPGVGPVFALGSNTASLLGLSGDETRLLDPLARDHAAHATSPAAADCSEELAFFRQVLNEGHSVVVVRTESSQIATTACEILDRLGLSMGNSVGADSTVKLRQVAGAVVADLAGKIALARGSGLLRDTIRTLLEHGSLNILLNLEGVDFIDSAGLGELVRSQATVRSRGGHLKLVNPAANVHHLLRITKLDRVFDIAPDEFTALNALRKSAPAKSVG